MEKIGLALGAGGARGLSQIIMIEAFEELGIEPTIISGTSIGAIIGALYAAGLDSKEMKGVVKDIVFGSKAKFWEIHKRSEFLKMVNFANPGLPPGGFLTGEKFISFLRDLVKINDFKQLRIPIKIIATDYWTKKQVILTKGNLFEMVKASFSLPGLFSPVKWNGTLLIDGGMVNPLPYDVIQMRSTITVAVDVAAYKSHKDSEVPSSYEILFSAFQIMQDSIVQEKLKQSKPSIYVKTNIPNVRIHEFTKMEEIFAKAVPAKEKLKHKLAKLLNR